MKTVAVGIENLCVPCHAICKYCLLSSCKKATGVEYQRGKAFASRFLAELGQTRPDVKGFFYIGYCMDTPDLQDYIRFCGQTGSPSAEFLQMNGLKIREEQETVQLVRMITEEGIKNIDLTFYGTPEYHDRFAGRKGDFGFLLRILDAAGKSGLSVSTSIPLTGENVGQMEELLDILEQFPVSTYSVFLPHSKGRGRLLDDQRLTRSEFERLSQRVRTLFPTVRYRTEREWLEEAIWPKATKRTLTLCLTEENITQFETMPAEEIVRYLEHLDDVYYEQVPALGELARMYGDRNGERLFRLRDLHLKWQQMYLQEHRDLYDMNEERHHFSVRSE